MTRPHLLATLAGNPRPRVLLNRIERQRSPAQVAPASDFAGMNRYNERFAEPQSLTDFRGR
jgi:hypothetical protein